MKNIGRLRALGVMVGVVLGVLGVRAVNALRYPEREAPEVETDAPPAGVRVTEVREGDVNGYHFAPERPSRRGLVIVFGGSEGSPDYARAAAIAARGQEVLALRFFGQANQPATLAGIPVEFFGRALAWAESQGASLDPLTVIGTSKGAELSLLLPSFYDEIDNVVLFAPGRHAYQGLDFTRPRSSWTHAGVDVPYVPFARGDPASGLAMALAWLFGTPVSYRATYESEAAAGPAPLAVDAVRGHLLVFAGDDDRMWQSEVAAREILRARPGDTEIHVYPGAGHVFALNRWYARGMALGGSRDANAAALADSNARLDAALAAWHG